jgi:hypothetical protein
VDTRPGPGGWIVGRAGLAVIGAVGSVGRLAAKVDASAVMVAGEMRPRTAPPAALPAPAARVAVADGVGVLLRYT